MGYIFQNFFMQVFTEFYDALLMAGWTKVPPLTRKWQDVFMVTVVTFNPGKAKVGIAAIKELVDDIGDIRSPIPVFLLVFLIPDPLQLFVIFFDQSVVSVFAWRSGRICIKF